MPDNAPVININVADNRLDQPGFVRRWYPSDKELWPQSKTTDLYRWPGVKMVSLEPKYEPAPSEAAFNQWTCTGTGSSYVAISGTAWGSTGSTVINQVAPTATACNVVSTFTPEANQPFFADLYFYASTAAAWYADLRFCRNWALRMLYNGSVQIWSNFTARGETADWQYIKSFKTFEQVFNKNLRLAVYPTAHQELIIWAQGFDPEVMLEGEPLVSQDAEGRIYRTICDPDPVRLYVSSGAFCCSYRYMRFATSGQLILPVQSLPWDYAGAYELTGQVGRNRADYAPTVTPTMLDEAGAEIVSPADPAFRNFTLKLDLTSDSALFTPELNWAQLLIAPTTKAHAPTPRQLTGPGEGVLSVAAGAEMTGRRQSTLALSNLDGSFSSLWNALRMCSSITDVTGAVTYWKGYFEKTDGPQEPSSTRLELSGAGTMMRLDVPLSDAYIGDGQSDTAFVEQLFKRCGLAVEDYVIDVTNPILLPDALGEEEPLFQARDGKLVREMVEYLCKVWTGKDLYEDAAGIIHYGKIAETGTPVATLFGYENATAGALKYYNLTPVIDDENFYNVIVVAGADAAGQPILAYHYDAASVNDPTSGQYLGCEKLLMVVDSNLRTLAEVETALGYVVAEHGHPLEEADAETAWHDTLDVGNLVAVNGSGEIVLVDEVPTTVLYNWQVRSLARKWEPDARMSLRLRKLPDLPEVPA